MKLRKLTMYNFMPYGGEHHLEFPTDEQRNVTIVFGDNMRGKTSLLNAVRWCLYGKALGRHQKELDLAHMVNSDAVASRDFKMSVFLGFEANGHEYDLRREVVPRDLVLTPRNAGDFACEVHLMKDGRVVRGDEVDHELNQIVPEQVANFFLFDGELLQEYEELLANDSAQGHKIKEAIEQVLGVPALIDGRKRLAGLLQDAQRVQAKENASVKALQNVAEELMRTQERRKALEESLQRMRHKERTCEDEITVLDEQLAATEYVQRAKTQMDALNRTLSHCKRREEQLTRERLLCMCNAWQDLVQPQIEKRMQVLALKSKSMQDLFSRKAVLEERLALVSRQTKTTVCPECGQQSPEAKREAYEQEAVALRVDLADLPDEQDGFYRIADEINKLGRLRGAGVYERLLSIEGERDRILIDSTDAETKLEELWGEVGKADTEVVGHLREQKDLKARALGRVQNEMTSEQKEIDLARGREDQLSQAMVKSKHSRNERTTREVELYRALHAVFDEGITQLRNRLRGSVARAASETFMRLTTEKTYKHLEINDNYGLSIVDRENRRVNIRSAGAEQIVALALIDGLNHTAGKRAPIIMDTPLGRLDPRHRASVLSELPRMADQVVLLVHEGEIDRSRDLAPLADRIGAVFTLVRESSSQTRIEALRGEARA